MHSSDPLFSTLISSIVVIVIVEHGYIGVDKDRFTVVTQKNNIIMNNTRINCVLHTHKHKPTSANPCMEIRVYI